MLIATREQLDHPCITEIFLGVCRICPQHKAAVLQAVGETRKPLKLKPQIQVTPSSTLQSGLQAPWWEDTKSYFILLSWHIQLNEEKQPSAMVRLVRPKPLEVRIVQVCKAKSTFKNSVEVSHTAYLSSSRAALLLRPFQALLCSLC